MQYLLFLWRSNTTTELFMTNQEEMIPKIVKYILHILYGFSPLVYQRIS